jgi:hypothetical protein
VKLRYYPNNVKLRSRYRHTAAINGQPPGADPKNAAVLAGRAQKGHSRLNYAATPWACRQMESTES